MTTPGGVAPDGAWVVDSSYGSDITEQSAMNAIRSAPISAWQIAQDSWKYACQQQRKSAADLKDGQNGLKNRLDLLENVSAYGSAVMGYNWNLQLHNWYNLPFDTQLGPIKGAAVWKPQAESGMLTLKKGGLWRVDAHLTYNGYSHTGGSILPIIPCAYIEVVDNDGNVVSAREYWHVLQMVWTSVNTVGNASFAFSHTFVLPEMPAEDVDGASDSWRHVRVRFRFYPAAGSVAAFCKVLGGTRYSSLIATRWSRDSENVVHAPEVPDGGNLG